MVNKQHVRMPCADMYVAVLLIAARVIDTAPSMQRAKPPSASIAYTSVNRPYARFPSNVKHAT